MVPLHPTDFGIEIEEAKKFPTFRKLLLPVPEMENIWRNDQEIEGYTKLKNFVHEKNVANVRPWVQEKLKLKFLWRCRFGMEK